MIAIKEYQLVCYFRFVIYAAIFVINLNFVIDNFNRKNKAKAEKAKFKNIYSDIIENWQLLILYFLKLCLLFSNLIILVCLCAIKAFSKRC